LDPMIAISPEKFDKTNFGLNQDSDATEEEK
jgi:hypothetical protein